MKKTDFAMIILIASVSVGVAFALVSAIPGLKLSSAPVKIKTIDKYTTQLDEPDSSVFNKDAINPTVDVTIGSNDTSTTPESTNTTDSADANQTATPDSSTQPGTDTSQSTEQ